MQYRRTQIVSSKVGFNVMASGAASRLKKPRRRPARRREGEDEWLLPHDVLARLPGQVAEKLMDSQRGQPGYHRPHALCDDDALPSYRVPKYLLQRQQNSSSSESKRRMTAKFDNNSSAEALADLADAEASASSGSQLALIDAEIPAATCRRRVRQR